MLRYNRILTFICICFLPNRPCAARFRFQTTPGLDNQIFHKGKILYTIQVDQSPDEVIKSAY